MPNSAQPSPTPAARPQVSPSLFARLAERPGRSRGRSFAIVIGLIALIGWLDYVTGIRVSLDLFYIIPIMLSVAWLGWRTAGALAVACILTRVGGDLANGAYTYPLTAFWNRLGDLCIYFIVVWTLSALLALWRELEERVRLRTAALEQAIAARDQLQSQLFDISRRERSAIGHDLHDGLAQHLMATSIATNLLSQRLEQESPAAVGDARNIAGMLQEGIGMTGQIARGLLLAAVEPDQLIGELEEMLDALGQEQDLTCRLTHRGPIAGSIDLAAASHIFYIAQEAAGNAVRHARPTKLEIDLTAAANRLELTITDNGRGMPPPESRAGMGLRIMAHRAELIGGHFEIIPAPGGGTMVRCRIPLSVQAHLASTP